MTDYPAVQQALASGLEPAMLCATCPWDRNCVTPPDMTSDEVQAKMTAAAELDKHDAEAIQTSGGHPGMPRNLLLTAITIGGRDLMGQFCPVFALRLRTRGGRQIADQVKVIMQDWDDSR